MRLRRFDASGARALLEKAIEADPRFALAHSALATAWSTLGYDERARAAAEAGVRAVGQSATGRAHARRRHLSRDGKRVGGRNRHLAVAVDVLSLTTSSTRCASANAQIESGAAKEGLCDGRELQEEVSRA